MSRWTSLGTLTRLEMQALIHDLWRASACTAILVTHEMRRPWCWPIGVLFIDQGRIRAEFAIDLPRPRNRTSGDFQRLVRRILDRVML
jgi:sulfonate transport system ATP-binding protein